LVGAACDTAEPPAQAAPAGADSPWTEVWADEFNGATVDAAKWNFEVGTGVDKGLNGWGNDELEYYTSREENTSVQEGVLRITARHEAFEGSDYTSARLTSEGLFSVTYGRVEARMKLPIGQGIWPAFWLLGNSIGEQGWPACGEIDLMEFRGQLPNTVSGALHGEGYSGGGSLGNTYSLPGDARFSEDFHIFSLEWDPGRIAWLVDGELFHLVTPASIPAHGTWAFSDSFFLILNLAVGGNYVGSPDHTTEFPQTLEVDYIRVFKREEGL